MAQTLLVVRGFLRGSNLAVLQTEARGSLCAAFILPASSDFDFVLGTEAAMKVRKFGVGDVRLERSPGQDADIFVGNAVDEKDGGPVTIGFGRYEPGASLTETMKVDDTMIVLEGRLSVATDVGELTAGPGEIVYMPKGQAVTIRAHETGALTAYVTYPHWREERD